MGDTRVDVPAGVRRNRLVLTVAVVGLLGVLVVLVVMAASSGEWSPGLLGLALFVGGLGLLALDAWTPRARRAPELASGGTVLRSAPVVGVAVLLFAVGFFVLMLAFVLTEGLGEAASERRGGGLLYVAVVLAPLMLVGAVALALRPDQVVLRPDGVQVRRGGRTTTVPWDDVVAVEPVGGPADSVALHRRSGRTVPVPTRYLALDGARLRGAVERLRADPARRRDLDTAAGPGLVAGARRPHAPDPRPDPH